MIKMGPKDGIREDMREDLLNTWYFQLQFNHSLEQSTVTKKRILISPVNFQIN